MSDVWNATDLAILREQFPTLFMFEEWFSEEEQAELERLETSCEICGWNGEGIHDDSMCNPESQI